MDIKKQINKNLSKVQAINAKKTEAYKERIKAKIVDNLKAGQTAEQQKPLADRYYSAKPQQFTQMQEAFQGAL